MKRFIAAMAVVFCLLAAGPWAAEAKEKDIPYPLINGFRLEQVGEKLRITFNFRNLAGGIFQTTITNIMVMESRGIVHSSETIKKIATSLVVLNNKVGTDKSGAHSFYCIASGHTSDKLR